MSKQNENFKPLFPSRNEVIIDDCYEIKPKMFNVCDVYKVWEKLKGEYEFQRGLLLAMPHSLERIPPYIPYNKCDEDMNTEEQIRWLRNSGIIICCVNPNDVVCLKQCADIPPVLMSMSSQKLFELLMQSGIVCCVNRPEDLLLFLLERGFIIRKPFTTRLRNSPADMLKVLRDYGIPPKFMPTEEIAQLENFEFDDEEDLVRYLQKENIIQSDISLKIISEQIKSCNYTPSSSEEETGFTANIPPKSEEEPDNPSSSEAESDYTDTTTPDSEEEPDNPSSGDDHFFTPPTCEEEAKFFTPPNCEEETSYQVITAPTCEEEAKSFTPPNREEETGYRFNTPFKLFLPNPSISEEESDSLYYTPSDSEEERVNRSDNPSNSEEEGDSLFRIPSDGEEERDCPSDNLSNSEEEGNDDQYFTLLFGRRSQIFYPSYL
jgi:hypothetical protein